MSENSDDSTSTVSLENRKKEIDWPVPKLFLQYGRGWGALVVLASILSVLSPIVNLVPTFLLQTAIDAVLLDQRPFALPGIATSLLPTNRLDQLFLVASIMVGAAGLSALLTWGGNRFWGLFAQEVQHEVRIDAYEKLQQLGVDFFDNHETGQIMSVLNNDVNQLNEFLSQAARDLLRLCVRFVGIAGILFFMHWQLALFAFMVVPVLALISRYFVKRIRPKFEEVRRQIGMLNSRIENNVSGIRVIKGFTAESYEKGRVEEASEDVYDSRWDVITTQIKFYPAMKFVNWFGFGVLIVLGGIWIIDGPPLFFTMPLSVGTLVTFLVYNRQFSRPLMLGSQLIETYQDARASIVRIFALLEYEDAAETGTDGTEIDRVDGYVSGDDVTFSYDQNQEPVLDDVSFEIEPGSFVGIVGPTGSGKTTLTKLLLQLYQPDSGTIRLDGHDVSELDVQSLRESIGMVFQDPYIFSGTVRENVAYGRPDVTDEELEWALRMANAHEFVMDLQNGYDTEVGQRGVKLSGGQRQRIAIARAVMSDPDLFILDEATSQVDNETEALIRNSLSDIRSDRTTIAIAHRLSTIRHADKILVLENGEIVERGSHEELLANDGLYANLWRVQVGELHELPEQFLPT